MEFISNRDDGLCMRLNTILDAAVLADIFGGVFRFYWSETKTREIDQQTTDSAAKVFADSFLKSHRIIDSGTLASARRLASLADMLTERGEVPSEFSANAAFLVDHPLNIAKQFPQISKRLSADSYLAAFDEIGFSADVQGAVRLAREFDFPNQSAVIHIRGGDILHGTCSHMGSYLDKAPSIPEIRYLIERLQKTYPAVWLIGQEPDLQAALARNYTGVFAFGTTHAPPDLTDAGRVIFDAVLMSRAARIVGGFSGVTHLSRRLGNVSVMNMSGKPSGVRMQHLLSDPMRFPEYADVSANIKAHVYLKFVMSVAASQWNRNHLRVLRLAKKYRPDSKFIAFIEICLMVHLDEIDRAQPHALRWLTTPIVDHSEPEVYYSFLADGTRHFPITEASLLLEADCDASTPLGCVVQLARSFLSPREKLARLPSEEAWKAFRRPAFAPIDPGLRKILTPSSI